MAKGDFAHPLFKSQVMLHIIALAFVGRVWSVLAMPGPIDNIIAVTAMYFPATCS